MSVDAALAVPTKKSPKRFLVFALSGLILLLLYGAGFIVLPISVLTNFQGRDCNSAITFHKIYQALYPAFLKDGSLSAPVSECQVYVTGTSNEAKGLWSESYDAYRAYSAAYPNGLFATDAHQRSGFVLVNIAREQAEQKKYEQAVASLDLVVASYSDTGVINEAWGLYPSMYTSWGRSLRDAQDFAAAEQVFQTFLTWSQHNQRPESVTDAQKELAQTYLAWGLDLQDQQQFEDAIARFDMVLALDTESQSDAAAQAKSAQRNAYMQWGNESLEQNQFQEAIEKYQRAVSLADDIDAEDALANAQIHWATDLSAAEDFLGGLEHLKTVKDAALSADMKTSLEAAFGETYLAFSRSTGLQAQQAMKDVLKTVCAKDKAPDLPIFGLNPDVIRLGIDGVEDALPDILVAKSPGEMHYVACVEAQKKTIESRRIKRIILYFSRGYLYEYVDQYRIQILWDIKLFETGTRKTIAETTLLGGTPPPFPVGEDTSGDYFSGPPPLDELEEWFQSVIN